MRTTSILIVSCIVLSCLLLYHPAQAGYIVNAPKYLGLERGLVGFWSFDGKHMAGNRAFDVSGQGNYGTLTGSNGLPVRTIGKMGQGLSFSKSTAQYVNAGSGTSLDDITTKTICAWIYPRSFGVSADDATIVSKYDNSGGNHGWYMQLADDDGGIQTLYVAQQYPGGIKVWRTNANFITLNMWQHVCITHNNSTSSNVPTVYINTIPQTMTVSFSGGSGSPLLDENQDLAIGNLDNGAVTTFDGTIDDVRIYNRALSKDEIKRLYRMGTSRTNTSIPGPANGLVGYWSFDGRDTNIVNVAAGGAGGTMGETNILGITDSGNGDLLLAQQATLSQSGTIQSLSFYVETAAGDLRLGVYDDDGPSAGPGTKLAETAGFTPVSGWNTANVTSPVVLSSGTYWLAYNPSSSSLSFRRDGTGSFKMYTFPYAPLPDTFSASPSSGTDHWSFYATLSDVAGGTFYTLDRSGQGHTGKYFNATSTRQLPGRISQGLTFDGVDDYLRVGNAGSGIKTISFWIKANVTAGSSQQFTNTYSEAGTFTWNASTTASTIQVDAWGGGGAGGGNTQTQDGAGGGGGGAYAKETAYAIVQNNNYTVVVGAAGTGVANAAGGAGGQSYFVDTSTLLANGGDGGGMASSTVAGAGGDGGMGLGDTTFNGGAGGAGRESSTGRGGGGGEGAGSTADGGAGTAGNGTDANAPGGSGTDGGDGGSGGAANANGNPGSAPGGGGGGSGDDAGAGDRAGGDGAVGRVVITWTETGAGGSMKLIDIDGTDQIEISSNAIAATSFPNATVYVDGVVQTAVDGAWHHVVVVDTTGVNASAMDIGRAGGSYFNGIIDDVRLYDRVLSADEIKRLYNTGGTFTANTTIPGPQSGLVGWWTFDGKAMAGNRAFDMSGQGNYGTLTGANGLPVRTIGKMGQGMAFDNNDDVISINDAAKLFAGAQLGQRTYSAWIYPHSLGESNFGTVVLYNTGDNYIQLCSNNTPECPSTANTFVFKFGSSEWAAPANSIIFNQWQHVAVTYDCTDQNNNASLYVNGSKVAAARTQSGDVTGICNDFNAFTFYIGNSNASDSTFDGTLDDVRVYNRLLSADEIKRLYNSGK